MKLFSTFALFASVVFAGSPSAIGVVTASGHFNLEGSRIWGNSTLFDGATVETGDASSELALSNGVKVQLAAGSSVRVWKNRLELQRGTGQITASSAFQVNAGDVSVEGVRYRVALQKGPAASRRLEVAAFTGSARVSGAGGNLLAAISAGRNMSFAMQQPVTRTGCLVYKDNGFLLQVDDSQQVLQLVGGPLADNVGNRVSVTGSEGLIAPTISPATLILNVTALQARATGGCLTIAAALNAQTSLPSTPAVAPRTVGTVTQPGTPAPSAPTVAREGMSTGAKVAIIGAVAGGGAGAALALGGKKSSTSP